MSTFEMQNILIRRILSIDKLETLEMIDTMIHSIRPEGIGHLSDLEESFINKSLVQIGEGNYLSNEEVFEKTKKWLDE